jgi:hypothetical protein
VAVHDPPADAELYDYEGIPVSRVISDLSAQTLVWTPEPRPASPLTTWRAVTESPPISREEFDDLRRSFAV